MNCPDPQLLSAYHDGELSPDVAAGVEAHLVSGCAPCRAELASLRRLSVAFDTAEVPRLSATARGRIYDTVADAWLTPAWVKLVLPVAKPFAAAAVLLIAFGTVLLASAEGTGGSAQVSAGSSVSRTAPTAWETTAVVRDTDEVALTALSSQTASAAQYAEWIVSDLSTPSSSH